MRPSKLVCAVVAASGLVCLAASGVGCTKEKDSLIVVSVVADGMAGDVNKLTLSAGGTTKVFTLTKRSGRRAGKVFGLYVSSDAIGDVTVDATASRRNSCVGYKGQGTANIAAAGRHDGSPTDPTESRRDLQRRRWRPRPEPVAPGGRRRDGWHHGPGGRAGGTGGSVSHGRQQRQLRHHAGGGDAAAAHLLHGVQPRDRCIARPTATSTRSPSRATGRWWRQAPTTPPLRSGASTGTR